MAHFSPSSEHAPIGFNRWSSSSPSAVAGANLCALPQSDSIKLLTSQVPQSKCEGWIGWSYVCCIFCLSGEVETCSSIGIEWKFEKGGRSIECDEECSCGLWDSCGKMMSCVCECTCVCNNVIILLILGAYRAGRFIVANWIYRWSEGNLICEPLLRGDPGSCDLCL